MKYSTKECKNGAEKLSGQAQYLSKDLRNRK